MIVTPQTVDADFLKGVALFDEMLQSALAEEVAEDLVISHVSREGRPFRAYLMPLVLRLLERPELAVGFASVLGTYLHQLCSSEADFDSRLEKFTRGDFEGKGPAEDSMRRLKAEFGERERVNGSNVFFLRAAAPAGTADRDGGR